MGILFVNCAQLDFTVLLGQYSHQHVPVGTNVLQAQQYH